MTEKKTGKGAAEKVAKILKELRNAGLPFSPEKMIGMKYCFAGGRGSHDFILVGTVTAIYFSDEGGLELHITSPEIWGCKIRSIMKLDDGWAVYTEPAIEQEIADRFFHGELYFLESI